MIYVDPKNIIQGFHFKQMHSVSNDEIQSMRWIHPDFGFKHHKLKIRLKHVSGEVLRKKLTILRKLKAFS